MPTIERSSLSFARRLRLWLSTPIAARLVMLAGAMLIGYGYSEVLSPMGSVEQVTRQAVEGILIVVCGAALVGAVVFWRD